VKGRGVDAKKWVERQCVQPKKQARCSALSKDATQQGRSGGGPITGSSGREGKKKVEQRRGYRSSGRGPKPDLRHRRMAGRDPEATKIRGKVRPR